MLNKTKILKIGPNFGARVTLLNLYIFQKIFAHFFFTKRHHLMRKHLNFLKKSFLRTTLLYR